MASSASSRLASLGLLSISTDGDGVGSAFTGVVEVESAKGADAAGDGFAGAS